MAADRDEDESLEERAKAFEAILRAKPPLVTEEGPSGEAKPKPRDILFHGNVYQFKPIGPATGAERRSGVVERWQADVHVDDEVGFNVVVDEFFDGRYTPWSFDGIFFSDFMQAVIVGLVAGGYEHGWQREKWRHERTRNQLMLFALPAVFLIALLVGIIIGVRRG
jgi:hypothetical protein